MMEKRHLFEHPKLLPISLDYDLTSLQEGILSKEVAKQTGALSPLTRWRLALEVAVVFCGLVAFFAGLRWQLRADHMCMQRNSIYSPIWKDINPKYHYVTFNGTLDAQVASGALQVQ
jgi:hypothetical protein